MREKLNSNPMAQAAVVGVLLLGAVFFLMSSMGGGEEAEAPPEGAEPTVSITGAEGPVDATAAPGVVPTLPPGAAGAAPPPPPAVTAAFKANRTVALLFVREGGIDDRLTLSAARRLRSLPRVSVFVVPAGRIARYAAIAQGVAVDRVPALVVMRPKRLARGIPAASVSYGFQSPESVVQAVVDAGYRGRTLDYHP
jgi:hypothetical protein